MMYPNEITLIDLEKIGPHYLIKLKTMSPERSNQSLRKTSLGTRIKRKQQTMFCWQRDHRECAFEDKLSFSFLFALIIDLLLYFQSFSMYVNVSLSLVECVFLCLALERSAFTYGTVQEERAACSLAPTGVRLLRAVAAHPSYGAHAHIGGREAPRTNTHRISARRQRVAGKRSGKLNSQLSE